MQRYVHRINRLAGVIVAGAIATLVHHETANAGSISLNVQPRVSPKQVAICHIPNNIFCYPPNPGRTPRRPCNYKTTYVAPRAVAHHLEHGDFLGECDPDNDGVRNDLDNCPSHANANQADADGDGVGTACDNCPASPNANQADGDGDGNGDACDRCPGGADNADTDADGTPNFCDGCPGDAAKTAPGACGCGVADADTNGNGTPDCIEPPPTSTSTLPPPTSTATPTSTVPPPSPTATIDPNCPSAGADNDGDGFLACIDDCNDNNATVHPNPTCVPGQICTTPTDVACDGIDRDCSDGLAAGGCEPVGATCPGNHPCKGLPCNADNDGDGFPCLADCNDNDAAVHPNPLCVPGQICTGRFDLPCDGKDIDCSRGFAAGGCEPLTAACSPHPCGNVDCGTVPDLCGGTIACGTCDVGRSCIAGQCCFHEPLSCTLGFELPDFRPIDSCGVLSDGCGGSLDCTGCPDGENCNQETFICEPGPTPPPCVPNCGTNSCGMDDGCGGICTTCEAGLCEQVITEVNTPSGPIERIRGFCKPFCSAVSCGACIASTSDTLTIRDIEHCPSGTVCNGGNCVVPPPGPCPQGCADSEVCDPITNQCKCGSDICVGGAEYCVQIQLAGEATPACCFIFNLVCSL